MLKKSLIALAAITLLFGLAIAEDSTEVAKAKGDDAVVEKAADSLESKDKKKDEWVETESGLKYHDKVVGEGRTAANGDKVTTHYTLWLADGDKPGKRLQSSKDGGRTFEFVVGQMGLIKGWNEGMVGMKEGGTRQLIIPPDIGYGARGRAPLVPGNATLFFEIELISIAGDSAKEK